VHVRRPLTRCCIVLLAAMACSKSSLISVGDAGSSQTGDGGLIDGGLIDAGQVTFIPPKACSSLPQMTNVRAFVQADNINVTFDPVDGGKDYRIYLVPPDGSDAGAPGTNMTYRCAGDRESYAIPNDAEAEPPSGAEHAIVNGNVLGFTRAAADATIGYVYPSAGDGLVPIYAVGDPSPTADNSCFFMRWNESQGKQYVTTTTARDALLLQGWKDFGIAFYVPSDTTGTVPVYTAVFPGKFGGRMHFSSAAELNARASLVPTVIFNALAAQASGTVPLMHLFYSSLCGSGHDELLAGNAKYVHARFQGNTPVTTLQWSGLSGPGTVAIEALDSGCPFQGHISPVSMPATVTKGSTGAPLQRQPFFTIDQVRAADPNQNVFINGEHDGEAFPQAIACSQIDVTPAAPDTTLDFHDAFDNDPGPFTNVPTGITDFYHLTSPRYDFSFVATEAPIYYWGVVLNQLWVTYADAAADTNGKFRMTPLQKATMADTSFVHATMQVGITSTDRRYPQLLISTASAPLQNGTANDNLTAASTIVVEPIKIWPTRFDIQFCDHRPWDVNNQCPHFVIDWSDISQTNGNQPPVPLVGEFFGNDRNVQFDVYASTQRVYAFLDGHPMGCATLPAGRMPAGNVSVTFGDVLYHSAVDVPDPPYTFHAAHQQVETIRHFDEIGFKSGVAAPAWNETLLPCTSTTLP
jgi:hypothetical protein